jgi:hypothetical protein
MRDATGQTAVEYLAVFSAALFVIAVATTQHMIGPAERGAERSLALSQARTIADAVASAIDLVFASGPGAIRSVDASLNLEWGISLDNSTGVVRVIVGNDNIEARLRYPVENFHQLSPIPPGEYTVVVQWAPRGAQENIDGSALDRHMLYINLAPDGV